MLQQLQAQFRDGNNSESVIYTSFGTHFFSGQIKQLERGDVSLKKKILENLEHLFRSSEKTVAGIHSGILEILGNLCSSDDADIRRRSCQILCVILMHPRPHRLIINTGFKFQPLMNCLQDTQAEVRLKSALSLERISQNRNGANFLFRENLVQFLISRLIPSEQYPNIYERTRKRSSQHEKHIEVCGVFLKILSNLCSNIPEVFAELSELSVMDLILLFHRFMRLENAALARAVVADPSSANASQYPMHLESEENYIYHNCRSHLLTFYLESCLKLFVILSTNDEAFPWTSSFPLAQESQSVLKSHQWKSTGKHYLSAMNLPEGEITIRMQLVYRRLFFDQNNLTLKLADYEDEFFSSLFPSPQAPSSNTRDLLWTLLGSLVVSVEGKFAIERFIYLLCAGCCLEEGNTLLRVSQLVILASENLQLKKRLMKDFSPVLRKIVADIDERLCIQKMNRSSTNLDATDHTEDVYRETVNVTNLPKLQASHEESSLISNNCEKVFTFYDEGILVKCKKGISRILNS